MAQFTAGELQVASFRAEAAYGTIQTGAMSLIGLPETYTPTSDLKGVYNVIPGSRAFGSYHSEGHEYGFKAKLKTRTTLWTAFFALYGLGAAGGTTDHIGSFTALLDMLQTTHNYDIYPGSKINKLNISAARPYSEILFDIECFSKYQYASRGNKVLNTLQNVTLGDSATDPATAMIRWVSPVYINIAGGGDTLIYPETWNLTIDNHLSRENGLVVGYDEGNYQVAVSLNEGIREIILEMKLIAQNRTYWNARLNGTLITSVQLTIDGSVITLGTGYIIPNEFPESKQDLNTETVKIKFKTITIA